MKYRGEGKHAETGLWIKPIVIDEMTGEKIGTRPIRILIPDDDEFQIDTQSLYKMPAKDVE